MYNKLYLTFRLQISKVAKIIVYIIDLNNSRDLMNMRCNVLHVYIYNFFLLLLLLQMYI